MSLRIKFIAAIIFINCIAMIVIYSLTQNILINNASQLERQNAQNAIERTSKIIEKRTDVLAHLARDYSVWDDTYNYVEEQNEEYVELNYNEDVMLVNTLNVAAAYSLQNERLFSSIYDLELNEEEIFPILNELLLHANQAKSSGIYLNTDGTAMYYALHPISTSDEKTEPNGMLIMIRKIGNEEMTLVKDQAGREITWLPFQQQNRIVQEPHLTTASIQLNNIGAGTLSISAHIPRDITQNVIQAQNAIIVSLAVVTLFAIIGTYSFVNFTVLKPVNQIVKGVQSINSLGKKKQYIQVTTHDEFQHVSNEINTMLSKLKNSQDELVQAQSEIAKHKAIEEKKDEFFSIASHELRTPLTAIRGNVEYLNSAYPELLNQNKGLKDALSDMHHASMRLIKLVNDFLTTSRIDQNKMKPNITTYDAYTAVKDTLQDISKQVTNNGLTISIEQPSTPVDISIDLQFLQHILENLVGNSIKFTPKGGSIQVKFNIQKQTISIVIKDTGRGIALEDQKELFQRFRQAKHNPLAHDTTQGSGLGLYIARKMARAMKGDVDLLQSEVGKGSTFIVSLPRAIQI